MSAPAVPTRSIMLLSIAAFASAANIRVPDALLPQVSADFAVSVGTASVIVTGYTLAYGLLQAFYGPVGDRYGKYLVAAITTLLSAVFTLACAFAPNLEFLATARFLAAAVSCAVIPLSIAWVGDVVPYEQRQNMLSKFISGQILGMIFGQIAGGILGDIIGWRMVFVVLAGIYVLAGLALFAEMRRVPLTRIASNPTASLNPIDIARQYAALLRRPWVRTVLVVVCLEGLLFFAAFVFAGNELHHRFGLSFTMVGLALTAFGAGGMSYALFAQQLVRRLGERGLAIGGSAVLCLALPLFALAGGLVFAVLAVFLCGLGFYMLHGTLQTNGTQMAPEARGSGVALFASSLFIGQSIGVAVAAVIVDRWGAVPVFLACGPFLLAIGLFFASALRRRP
ncbi:MAG: ynfM 7 [Alphaproteobacteria bacterium]|jgi:predicted MFS family arabinose efflux permease|nr:ynfM 7 [Alphaproteobacteria bacterium]